METRLEQRVNFHIPVWLHKELKIMAIEKNITLKKLMLRIMAREAEKYKKNR